MICPKCNNPLSEKRSSCDHCGFPLNAYQRVLHLSNLYYNYGLEKARVRDLTGAELLLRKSLQMNKRNINARNLLGLVVFEMGEVVSALSEWVISKYFQSDHNDADYYMGLVQDSPTKLDDVNSAIRKYNVALEAAKQGNQDLAIIQLKKVITLNPKFIRALTLLSLLYLQNNEFERTKRQLQKVLKIDIANTKALLYLKEVESRMNMGPAKVPPWSDSSTLPEGKEKPLLPLSSYKEDKPNTMLFVNLVLGVLIGIAVVYYLIVPTVEQRVREEYNGERTDYSTELSTQAATITQLEKSLESLEKKLTQKEKEVETLAGTTQKVEFDKKVYDGYFEAVAKYYNMKAQTPYTDEQLKEVAYALYEVKTKNIVHKEALEILERLRTEVYALAANSVYREGKALYDAGKQEEAVEALSAAVAFNPTLDTPLYYLGKSYQALNQYEEAADCYRKMLEVAPNSTLKQYIPQRLREMGMSE